MTAFSDTMTSIGWKAWWRLGASGNNDSSGNARNLSLFNVSPNNATSLIAGDSDGAFSKTGAISQFMYIGSPSWMNDASFSGWCRWKPNTSDTTRRGIFGCLDGNNAGSWRVEQANGGVAFCWGGGNFSLDFGVSTATGTAYTLGFSYDSPTTTLKLYVNGTMTASSTTASVPNLGTQRFTIGSASSNSYDPPGFYGVADEVAYAGFVLTDTQQANLHTSATTNGVTVAGQPWTAPAAWRDGTLSPVVVSGGSWTAPATWLDGTIPNVTPVNLNGEPWVTPATWQDGTLLPVVIAGTTWAAPATWLDGLVAGASVLVAGDPWTVDAVWVDGAQTVAVLTEQRNRSNGRSRTGSGENRTALVTVATTTTEPIRIMAQQLPTPTLKNGRPQ